MLQNLFHDQVHVGHLLAQTTQILRRIVETVDMVDPQAVDLFLGHQFQNQLMREVEDLGVLDPQRDQVVDGEKPPIIQFLVTNLPVGQPEELLVEQAIHQVEAFGFSHFAIENTDILLDELAHLGATVPQLPQHLLDEGNLIVALLPFLAGRDVLEQIKHPQELDEVRMSAIETGAQPPQIVGQQSVIGLDADREAEIVVVNGQSLLAVAQLQFTAFQAVAVELAEKGRQHPTADAFVQMVPVDVEKLVIERVRAIFQHIHQYPVLAIESHVVGHDILHPADALFLQHLTQQREPLHAAQFGIDEVRVHHVVTVLATLARREDRRGINIGHPQFGQIGGNGGCGVEAKIGRELQAIGRDGNAHHGIGSSSLHVQAETPAA